MRNRYFNIGLKSEQNLYEDIALESIKIFGYDMMYLPREILNQDNVTGEDIMSRFEDAYPIEMYIENIDGFDGEGDLFTRFGVEIRDAATFVVARRRFNQAIAGYEEFDRPREGDLIYMSMSDTIFEIMHVDDETSFYQLENLPLWKMRVELFEHAGEDFDTGIADIDILDDHAFNQVLTLADSGSTPFDVGENITIFTDSANEPNHIDAEIVDWDESTDQLTIAHIAGNSGDHVAITDGQKVTSTDTGFTRTINSSEEEFGMGTAAQDSDTLDLSDLIDNSFNNQFGDLR
jgi:hypothetical protein